MATEGAITNTVQAASMYIIVGFLAIVLTGIIGFLLYRLYIRMTHKFHVTIYKKVGDVEIKSTDWAKKYQDEFGNYNFSYYKLKKKSKVIEDEYFRIVKTKMLGLFPSSNLGFDAYYINGKIIPMQINKAYSYNDNGELEITNVSLTGIDYDGFNFMQQEVKTILQKYERVDKWLQIMPYAAMFLVIVAFIVGSAIYAKHIENISMNIIGVSKQIAQQNVDKTGIIQKVVGA